MRRTTTRKPRSAALPAPPATQFDLPRWNLRIAADQAGRLEVHPIAPLPAGPNVSLLYACFLQARHDTDDMGSALHAFGLRTRAGPDYATLMVKLGETSERLGQNLPEDILRSPDVQAAYPTISRVGADLKDAVAETKLPTSTVETFNRGISLVDQIANLFKR